LEEFVAKGSRLKHWRLYANVNNRERKSL